MSSAAFKKQFSENFSALELPQPLDHMTPETLVAEMAAGGDGTPVRVIDVRHPDEYAKGSIKGSQNISLEDLLSGEMDKLVADVGALTAAGKRPSVVFVSLQSPDIDEAAALSFLRGWDEKNGGQEGASAMTHILLGGMFHFFQLYGKKSPEILVNYDAATWDGLLPKSPDDESDA